MPAARIALWVASIGGVALLVRSLVIGPVPMWLAVVLLLAYATFCTLGVLFPRLEMYGDVVQRAEGASDALALTFDDGPHPKTTRKVLEILERHGAKATFFVVGRKVREHPEVVREIRAAGHELGLHGYQHERLYALKPPQYVELDVRASQDAIAEVCGERPVLLRPPVGHVSSRTSSGARRAGVTLVAWSARSLDGFAGSNPAKVVRRIEPKLEAGAIVLLHDAAERDDFEPASIEALPSILKTMEERGLRAVTLSELLEGEHAESKPPPST